VAYEELRVRQCNIYQVPLYEPGLDGNRVNKTVALLPALQLYADEGELQTGTQKVAALS
jgi:hypothetical protein